MGARSRWVAAWGLVIGVAFAAQYLTAWALLPLVARFSAHSDPVAATGIVLIRLVLWLAIMGVAVWLASRLLKGGE